MEKPAIDRAVLGQWVDGDDAAIDGFLAVFRDSIASDVKQLRDRLARAELAAAARTSHSILGAAQAMGAAALAAAVAALHAAASAGDAPACAAAMPMLDRQLARMTAEVGDRKPVIPRPPPSQGQGDDDSGT